MVWISLLIILGLFLIAFLIDRRNKKLNNHSQNSLNSHAKQGESTNFTMGDNRYTSGGE
ncbi:hypothetical protein [Paenisporosarcina cavernae]|uniref:hypothetical protein n=1 Tax=Paenisporosarcina cavernae TaxID=2320858 RepID=UPI0013C4CEDB|nr:hypothetical protein [Paenisporosarcina cavernae]